MLLLVENFDTIAGVIVLTELRLILGGVELGIIVPSFTLEHIDCTQ
jgi:hypothetical protein